MLERKSAKEPAALVVQEARTIIQFRRGVLLMDPPLRDAPVPAVDQQVHVSTMRTDLGASLDS